MYVSRSQSQSSKICSGKLSDFFEAFAQTHQYAQPYLTLLDLYGRAFQCICAFNGNHKPALTIGLTEFAASELAERGIRFFGLVLPAAVHTFCKLVCCVCSKFSSSCAGIGHGHEWMAGYMCSYIYIYIDIYIHIYMHAVKTSSMSSMFF